MVASLPLPQRIEVATAAMVFFSLRLVDEHRILLGQPPRAQDAAITPLSITDFFDFLKLRPEWETVWDYAVEIDQLVDSLARNHLLQPAGTRGAPMFNTSYYQMAGLSSVQVRGAFWLAPVLGPQLIVHAAWTSLIHLTGVTKNGDQHGGTGLAVSDRHILTAKHVVDGMALNRTQRLTDLQGHDRVAPERHAVVIDAQVHPRHDLAVVTTDHTVQPLSPVNGLALRQPTWADPVLLLGYPIIPRAGETPMTVQLGEVVTPSVRTYDDNANLFLYSAIARPGNSGGPIIATDGKLVGLVTEELFEKPDDTWRRAPASPFYAGLPASVIQSGLADLGHPDLLVFED